MTALPEQAYAASLASLAHLTPLRLRALLDRMAPADAWEAVRQGTAFLAGLPTFTKTEDPIGALQAQAAKVRPEAVWESCQRTGTTVTLFGTGEYPAALADDPYAPAVLFSRGDLGVIDGRRVAIIGTRRATAVGREMAADLGAELAVHGVRIVSGLASGIDGAAHRGVLSVGAAPPIGVVGSGLDVVYPRAHKTLWEQVAAKGVLLAEVPPGSLPTARRFPQRNRVIAALAEVVVVVESHERGGSLLTADQAMHRDRVVMAVPGSPRNDAAKGTNELLRDGCLPVLSTDDVLMQLGLGRLPFAVDADHRPAPQQRDVDILDLIIDRPSSIDELVHLSKRDVRAVAGTLARLEMHGWVVETAGCFERVHSPGRATRVP
jgi:DNA processing protein